MRQIISAIVLIAILFIPAVALADGWDDALERQIEQSIQQPHIQAAQVSILDYGANQMYCSTTTANGSATTAPVEMEGIIPTSFIVRSNNTFDTRRSWFDNLKIERVTAGAYDPTGIVTVKAAKVKTDAIYNLAGQKVDKNYKGIVVKDGRKMIQK